MAKKLTNKEEIRALTRHTQLTYLLSEALEAELQFIRQYAHPDFKRIVDIHLKCNKKFKDKMRSMLPNEFADKEENKALDKLEELYKIFGI